MNTSELSYQAAIELAATLKNIDNKQVDQLIKQIKQAKRIFVTGAGRSLLMLKAFAMRLMHIGYEVYIVGEVTTPALLEGDLLIVASASSETATLLRHTSKAKQYGGKIVAITIFEHSSLAQQADDVVKVPAYTDKLPASDNNKKGVLPGGSLFEQAVLLLGDALIVDLASEHNIDTSKAFTKHANLE